MFNSCDGCQNEITGLISNDFEHLKAHHAWLSEQFVCVREREKGRQRERERERESVCVCECVCVCV